MYAALATLHQNQISLFWIAFFPPATHLWLYEWAKYLKYTTTHLMSLGQIIITAKKQKEKKQKTTVLFIKTVEITDARWCQVYLYCDVKWEDNGNVYLILPSPSPVAYTTCMTPSTSAFASVIVHYSKLAFNRCEMEWASAKLPTFEYFVPVCPLWIRAIDELPAAGELWVGFARFHNRIQEEKKSWGLFLSSCVLIKMICCQSGNRSP